MQSFLNYTNTFYRFLWSPTVTSNLDVFRIYLALLQRQSSKRTPRDVEFDPRVASLLFCREKAAASSSARGNVQQNRYNVKAVPE